MTAHRKQLNAVEDYRNPRLATALDEAYTQTAKEQCQNFPSVVRLFILILSIPTRNQAFRDARKLRLEPHQLYQLVKEIDRLFLVNAENPDPAFVEIAQRVFEQYPTQPDVLFQEFMKLVKQGKERKREE